VASREPSSVLRVNTPRSRSPLRRSRWKFVRALEMSNYVFSRSSFGFRAPLTQKKDPLTRSVCDSRDARVEGGRKPLCRPSMTLKFGTRTVHTIVHLRAKAFGQTQPRVGDNGPLSRFRWRFPIFRITSHSDKLFFHLLYGSAFS